MFTETLVYYITMKNIFKFLLLSPIAFSTVGCGTTESKANGTSEKKDPQPVDVVVISGQSNAVGCTHCDCIGRSMGYSKYNDYMVGYPEIKIAYDCWTKDFNSDGKAIFYSQNKHRTENFVKVMLGQGNSEATFGPEIGIAETLNEKYANKLFLIKYACGASNLKDDWAQRTSPMYPRLVAYVKKQMQNLVDSGYIPTIKAFCWMQGEGDSYDGYYQDYYENIKGFVTNLRTDLKDLAGNKDFPFIDAGISNSKDWRYYREVNNAKKQFADESTNNFYIDTIAAGMHTDEEPFASPDTCHYDSESEVLLGKLFAESFEQFLTPETEVNE